MQRKELSRQLAAILFTDIVGYTTMMQRDEDLALASVRRHHDVLEKTIPTFDGEIYQYYGDGSLSIFPSATQAVQCAFEIQKQMLQEPAVYVRTGIHIGEIYTEGGKIFGDGVNLASRIESIGQGGTVLFSRDVYEKIRNHNTLRSKSLGTFEFKNVEDPVDVFFLTNPEIITPDKKLIDGKLKEKKKKSIFSFRTGLLIGLGLVVMLGLFIKNDQKAVSDDWDEEKSVAVLPFKNYGDNRDEEFLSIGIADDILVQLSQIKDLKVISQASSMKYKDSDKDLMIIASELGVTSLLDGSVQRHGDQLRISVSLIKASDESVIWSERFDGKIEDVLNVQRDVALAVSEKLKVNLAPQIKNRLEGTVNVDPEAYIHYQKGQELLKRSSGAAEDMVKARSYFDLSIREDSNFAQAWIGLADAWIETIFWHRAADEDALPQAKAAAMRARELDPASGESYGVLGAVNLLEHDISSAESNLRKSLELNPNYSFTYERLAWVEMFRGHKKECIDLYEKIIELDPLSTRYKGSMISGYYFMNRYKEGIERGNQFLSHDPLDNFLLWSVAHCHAGNKEYQKAIDLLKKRSLGTHTNWVYTYCYAKLGRIEEARKNLEYHYERKKTGHVPDFMMAVQHAALGEKEKAMDYLESSVNTGGENWFVLGFNTDPMLDVIRSEPRFIALQKRVKEQFF
jgi:TolB-like protein/class 3 adenylate cyclase/Flp pilus assembly protein TadD